LTIKVLNLNSKSGEVIAAVSESTLQRSDPRKDTTGPSGAGAVTVWAAIAVVWLVIAAQALVRWIGSSDFGPAPLLGPDRMPMWNLVALRVFEGISVALLFFLVWSRVIKPWRRTGALSLDGKFVLGGMAAFVADAFLNCYTYLFAWNAHNVNLGVWTAFLPFHNPAASSRYAESLLWGPPMYVYFCAGVASSAARPISRYGHAGHGSPTCRCWRLSSSVSSLSTLWWRIWRSD
jgi:hypothetical protein